MFASNFPVDKLFSSYDDVFNAFKAITKDFAPHERQALFHDNAQRVYRL
jgi:predicted TIM-barrel fold metal-dependent hydrolase